jgi:hypothetical protein
MSDDEMDEDILNREVCGGIEREPMKGRGGGRTGPKLDDHEICGS